MKVRSWLKRTQKFILILCALMCLGCITFEILILKGPRNLRLLVSQHGTRQLLDNGQRKLTNFQKLQDEIQRKMSKYHFKNESGTIDTVADSNSEMTLSNRKKMKAVVIVAGYRTGSSFIGQIFNQHSDVFYLFEPLMFSSWNRKSKHSIDQVLVDLLLCNFTSMRDEIRSAWEESQKKVREDQFGVNARNMREQRECMVQGLCFRGKTKAICTPEMCGNATETNCKLCRPPPRLLMQKACLDAKVRVLKVIRIKDLNVLKRSFDHPDIDLKIIHLNRDPRATLVSRLRLTKNLKNTDIRNIITPTCKSNVDIYKQYSINEEDNKWLDGIYKLVRYEDVVENPEKYAEILYKHNNFPNFTVNDEIMSWIRESTTHPDSNLFGTSRNTAFQKYRWRYKIPLPFVTMVQRECKEMMTLFGYKFITSRSQLLNKEDTLLEVFNGS